MTDYDPKTYWEERGKDYRVSVDTSAELRNLARLRLLQGWYSDQILEVGSGYGRIYEYLKSNGLFAKGSYSMCDISQSMVDECLKRTGIRPRLCTETTLPFDDESFDWIISFSVMLHVPMTEIIPTFREHLRVCKKYFYIATYLDAKNVDCRLAKHCFLHDYRYIIDFFKLEIVSEKLFMDGQRVNWLLKKT